MISEIVELVKQGVNLVKEGENRKRLFFENVVGEIHDSYLVFKKSHQAAFVHIKSCIKEGASLDYIKDYLHDRQMESLEWYRFMNIDLLGIETKARLGGYYSEYAKNIQRCLLTTYGDRYPELTFYLSLRAALEQVEGEKADDIVCYGHLHCIGCGHDDDQTRMRFELKLNAVIESFNQYAAEVEISYLKLKKYCMV